MLEGDTLVWAFASGEDAVRTQAAGFDRSFRVGEGAAGMAVQLGEAGAGLREVDRVTVDRRQVLEQKTLVAVIRFSAIGCQITPDPRLTPGGLPGS